MKYQLELLEKITMDNPTMGTRTLNKGIVEKYLRRFSLSLQKKQDTCLLLSIATGIYVLFGACANQNFSDFGKLSQKSMDSYSTSE